MEKIEVPDGVSKEEAEKYLQRKANQNSGEQGKSKKSRKPSSDDGDWDGLIVIGAVLLFLGWLANEVFQFVMSLF